MGGRAHHVMDRLSHEDRVSQHTRMERLLKYLVALEEWELCR